MMIDGLVWLGHAGFALDLPPLVIIDPHQVERPPSRKADVVLITHPHYDHLERESLGKVSGPATVFIAPADCLAQLPAGAKVIAPGEKIVLGSLEVEAVPAYNTDKKFHPRANGWVGYIVRHGGESLYHAGDTDLIPEMDSVRCDVAILPVSGMFVMTAEEAAEAARRINPKIVVPMHFGSVVGTRNDADRLKRLCPPPIAVRLPEKRPV